jgi:hypothetical protein
MPIIPLFWWPLILWDAWFRLAVLPHVVGRDGNVILVNFRGAH